ncbi:hypothetical protein GCM10010869_08820 [Mesorhizobium tianshanense]|nr:hypothetical protein GCM10010869_08820 [Mesorhizobium tianshanense]
METSFGDGGNCSSAGNIEVRDAAGKVLADGDSVALVKDLKIKGAGRA